MKSIQSILNSRQLKNAMHFFYKTIITYLVFLGFLAFAYMFLFVMGANEVSSKATIAELAKLDTNSQRNFIMGLAQGYKTILIWSAVLSLIFNSAGIASRYLIALDEKYSNKKFPRKTK